MPRKTSGKPQIPAPQHDAPSIVASWDRKDHSCNWMYVWQSTGPDQVTGKMGGYSGGGCWECYSFVATLTPDDVAHLVIDTGTDLVTGEEPDVELPWNDAVIDRCDGVFWEWNDEDADSMALSLKDGKLARVTRRGDQLVYERGDTDVVVLLSRYSPMSDIWNADENLNPGKPRP